MRKRTEKDPGPKQEGLSRSLHASELKYYKSFSNVDDREMLSDTLKYGCQSWSAPFLNWKEHREILF